MAKKQNLKYAMKKGALKQISSNKSKQTYMRGIKKIYGICRKSRNKTLGRDSRV